MDAGAARERLDRLDAEGCRRFDPLGSALVASLLARAEALGGGAEEILLGRIERRLDALEAAFRAARAEAEELLRVAGEEGLEGPPALAELLARGELAALRRAVRCLRRDRAAAARPSRVPWLARLCGAAQARDTALPEDVARGLAELGCEGGVVAHGARDRARALGNAVSGALYRESAERARAALAVARAVDNVPEDAGPYNGQVLAARALAAMEALSPEYVRTLIAGLDELAAMEALLEPAPVKVTKPKRPRRRAAA